MSTFTKIKSTILTKNSFRNAAVCNFANYLTRKSTVKLCSNAKQEMHFRREVFFYWRQPLQPFFFFYKKVSEKPTLLHRKNLVNQVKF